MPVRVRGEPDSFGDNVESFLSSVERPAGVTLLQSGGEDLGGAARSLCEFSEKEFVDVARCVTTGSEEFIGGDARRPGPSEPVLWAKSIPEAFSRWCQIRFRVYDSTAGDVFGVLADKENGPRRCNKIDAAKSPVDGFPA